jgi:hypothetical protein
MRFTRRQALSLPLAISSIAASSAGAAAPVPMRSLHPESLRLSKHWYDHVLPVLAPRQITRGGPIPRTSPI